MVDITGMQKNRPHIKKCEFATEMYETYFIRPSNGHSSPGIQRPESLYMRMADLTNPVAPCHVPSGKTSRIYFE
eukprot:9014230-Pyramimonas_sp.AAC.1